MAYTFNLSSGIELNCCGTEVESENVASSFQNAYNLNAFEKNGEFVRFFDEFSPQKQEKAKRYTKSSVSWNKEINDVSMEISDISRAIFIENSFNDLDGSSLFTETQQCSNSNEFLLPQGFPTKSPSTFSAALSGPADPSLPFCFSLERPRRKRPKIIAGRYLLGETIGQGSYGKVKDGIDLITLRRCAVKIVSKLGVRKIPGGWNQARTEASLLRRLTTHRHIVSVMATFRLSEPDRIVVIMEHCLGSVHDLQSVGVLSLAEAVMPSAEEKEPLSAFHRISTEPFFDQQEQAPINLPRTNQQALNERKRSVCQMKPDQADGFQQFRRLPEAQAHAYFLQLIDGLHYLHRNGIVHRDIKPANLLLTPSPGCGLNSASSLASENSPTPYNSSGVYEPGLVPFSPETIISLSRGYLVKLADFGVSTCISSYTPHFQVGGGQTTPAVQPPEVAKGAQTMFNGPMLDVYSAGVSLFFMLTGRVPFSSPNVLQIFEAIAEGFFTIPGYVSAPAANLIRGMMYKDPEKRLSLECVSRHEWVSRRLPPPPPSLSAAARACAARWRSDPPVKPQKLRGFSCWLDPMTYLRRPAPQFTAPHIDVTGARIFSLAEIEAMPESSLGGFHLSPADRLSSPAEASESSVSTVPAVVHSLDAELQAKTVHPSSNIGKTRFFSSAATDMITAEEDSWKRPLFDAQNSDMVAPTSVIESLKIYYNWSPDSDIPQDSSLFGKNLEDSLACLGIMDYDVSYSAAYNSNDQGENTVLIDLQPFSRPCLDDFDILCSSNSPPAPIYQSKPAFRNSRRVRWMSQPSADDCSSQIANKPIEHEIPVRRRNTASCSLDCQPPLSPDDIPVAECHQPFTIVGDAFPGIKTPPSSRPVSDHLLGPMSSNQLSRLAWYFAQQQQEKQLAPAAKNVIKIHDAETKPHKKKKTRLHLSSFLRRGKRKGKVHGENKRVGFDTSHPSNHSSSLNDISSNVPNPEMPIPRPSASTSAVSSLRNVEQPSQSSRLRRWFSSITCLRHTFRSYNVDKNHKLHPNSLPQVRSASAMAYNTELASDNEDGFEANTSSSNPDPKQPSEFSVVGNYPSILGHVAELNNGQTIDSRHRIKKCQWGLSNS